MRIYGLLKDKLFVAVGELLEFSVKSPPNTILSFGFVASLYIPWPTAPINAAPSKPHKTGSPIVTASASAPVTASAPITKGTRTQVAARVLAVAAVDIIAAAIFGLSSKIFLCPLLS
jgi:hypothetical protein